MLGGYVGKILWVDLTNEKVNVEGLQEKVAREYLGGDGFAAKIIWERTTSTTEPLSLDNPLIFMTGPLTGTIVPASSRYGVAALSPLTNIWGAAHSGGNWGDELKRAGFDGIVFTGKARNPVYLWVSHGEVRILDAGNVWGKDTWETSDILREETDPRASVACIGQAGERLVRIACVMNDGRDSRAAARCGLGAVMGSKNLKAVVVRGTTRPAVNDRQGLKDSIRRFLPSVAVTPEDWRERFIRNRQSHWKKGRAGIKNWLGGEFDGFLQKLTETMLAGKAYHCRGCRYSCHESAMVGGRRRHVYESIVPLGSQCLIDNLEVLQEAYDLCNRYGMDSISAGGVIAFGMEVFEKGLVTLADTEGIELKWGRPGAMVEMLRKIGEKEGFGAVLGEGVRRAAQRIGGTAAEYAIHVKGLELPGHDPRSANAMCLEYATSNRGGCHMSARAMALSKFRLPELGIPYVGDDLEHRFAVEGVGERIAKLQDFICVVNSLKTCTGLQGTHHSGQMVQPSHLLEWLNLATGWNMELKEFLKIGERIFNLERMINVRRGISRKDDIIHPRIFTHKRGGTSEAAQNLPPLGPMLSDYYQYREWSEEGIPTKGKLAELGLSECAR